MREKMAGKDDGQTVSGMTEARLERALFGFRVFHFTPK
jgi:hypothetical protein